MEELLRNIRDLLLYAYESLIILFKSGEKEKK